MASIKTHSQCLQLTTAPKYEQQQFSWSAITQASIDWPTFWWTIQTFHKDRTTIHEHVFCMQPTGHRAHQINKHLPASCPQCTCLFEGNNHILQYPNNAVDKWQQRLFPELKISIQKQNQIVRSSTFGNITDRISLWLSHQVPLSGHLPQTYQLVMGHKTKLGGHRSGKADLALNGNTVRNYITASNPWSQHVSLALCSPGWTYGKPATRYNIKQVQP